MKTLMSDLMMKELGVIWKHNKSVPKLSVRIQGNPLELDKSGQIRLTKYLIKCVANYMNYLYSYSQ